MVLHVNLASIKSLCVRYVHIGNMTVYYVRGLSEKLLFCFLVGLKIDFVYHLMPVCVCMCVCEREGVLSGYKAEIPYMRDEDTAKIRIDADMAN